MSRYLTTALEVLIILLVLFVPLAFGGTQYWAWTAMEVGVGVALVLWFILGMLRRRLTIVKTPLNIILVVLLAYVFFQLIPLPAGLTGMLSGKRVALTMTGSPTGEVTGGGAPAVPVSINRHETLQSWFRLLTYAGFFFLLVNFIDTRAKLGRLLGAVVLAGILVAFLGMSTSSQHVPKVYRTWSTGDPNENPVTLNARANKLFSSGVGYVRPIEEPAEVHWFRFKTLGGAAFGSFPSQNQAAGFLLMILPVALGSMFACLGIRRAEWGSAGGLFFSREGNLLLLSLVVSMVLILGIVTSQSRGGLLFVGPVLVIMCLLAGFTGSLFRGIITTVVLVLLIVVPVIVIGSFDLTQTTKEIINLGVNPWNETRLGIWQNARQIASDFPLVGTGVGTFGSIYPLYNSGGPQAYFAHCDPLQLRVESGILGLLIMGSGFLVYVVTGVAGFLKMRDKFLRRILIGTFLGSLALLAHSLIDYDLYVPATTFVFVVLTAVTVVLARDRNSRRTEEDFVF